MGPVAMSSDWGKLSRRRLPAFMTRLPGPVAAPARWAWHYRERERPWPRAWAQVLAVPELRGRGAFRRPFEGAGWGGRWGRLRQLGLRARRSRPGPAGRAGAPH